MENKGTTDDQLRGNLAALEAEFDARKWNEAQGVALKQKIADARAALSAHVATIKTVNRDTTQLNVGDIVQTQGCRFRLIECTIDERRALARLQDSIGREWAEKRGEVDVYDAKHKTLRAFRTEYLGTDQFGLCHIPGNWRDHGWTIQGNHLAIWQVEV